MLNINLPSAEFTSLINMVKKQDNQSTAKAKIETGDQISLGGVTFRWRDSNPEIAILSVKPSLRWQLPKGIVDPGEWCRDINQAIPCIWR